MYQKPQPNPHNQHLGRIGEDIAVSLLRTKGFRIVERNFRARYGEIDIVAIDQETLVFIEVKTRVSKTYGEPEEAVTPRKLAEVIQTAAYYRQVHPNLPNALRIDVVGIMLDPETLRTISIIHIPNVSQ